MAADLLWDANGATAGQTDGSGNWTNANQWWDGGVNDNWDSSAPDNATIGNGGSGGTITVGYVGVGTILFTNFTGTYTLNTNASVWGQLTNSSGITIATNASALTLNVPMVGAGGITKNNSSAMILTVDDDTNNLYTGATVVNGGILQLGTGWRNTQDSLPGRFNGSASGSHVELNDGNLKIWWPWTRDIGPDPEDIQFSGGASGFTFMQGDRYGQIRFFNDANTEVVLGKHVF